jgi:small-conductance mechanosensitive channel
MSSTGHAIFASHALWLVALLAIAIAASAAVRNRIIRRRLRMTMMIGFGLIGLHIALAYVPAMTTVPKAPLVEQLLLALAAINTFVALAFNPWFTDRVRDRAPAIVQDAIVIGFFLLIGMFVFQEDAHVFATSAIAVAVLGFALQETLGNAFAGLAIQVERPFRVGHWIAVGSHEGRVVEVTWRATKVRTKSGNLVILPNNIVAREAINNYSEPVAPTRIFVEVGATYNVPPNDVRDAILAAVASAPHVLAQPKPEVMLQDFAASSITYRAWFWIDDFSQDELARDEVRTGIYYQFVRRDIEIPYPIQIEFSRQELARDSPERREGFTRSIASVPVLAGLPAEAHKALAAAAEERLYANGEIIVREGEPGQSLFIVRRGRVAIGIGQDLREVAVTDTGGYFGEMSLLTGEPRTATVVARGDCVVLEITGEAFAAYVKSRPEAIDQLANAATVRKRAIDQTRAAAASAPTVEPLTLAQRMRKFFGLN